MIWNRLSTIWPVIQAFTPLLSSAVHCAADDPSASNAQYTAIQEAESEMKDARRLAELYTLVTGRQSEDLAVRSFVKSINGQIHLNRLEIEGGSVFIEGGSQSAASMPRIQLTKRNFRNLFGFFTETDIAQVLGGREYTLKYVLKLLSISISILTNPFSSTPAMIRFRKNVSAALKLSKTSNFRSCKKQGDVSEITSESLRTILDIYAGMSSKLEYFANQAYSADKQGNSLVVYDASVSYDPQSFTVLLHLIRLCKITELNIRNCKLHEPLSKEAQDILAACQITRLVPPLDRGSCHRLFLTRYNNRNDGIGFVNAQNRMWHKLTEISWFSKRNDWLQGNEYELKNILEPSEILFRKDLDRPAAGQEDFSALELLSISGRFPTCRMEYLKKAIKLRVLDVTNCHNVPAMDFLKIMTKLETLWLGDINMAELPGDILVGLSKLSSLKISGTQLRALPPEIGRLSELEKLVVTNNFLSAIPDTLSNCSKLTYLDLSGNNLQSLPDNLKNLVFLNISGNKNPELLARVSNFTGLKTLSIENTSAKTLPASINYLTNLCVLDLSSNGISEVPSVISELLLLREVNLSHNMLSALPSFMAGLKYLHTLYLDKNRFQRIAGFVEKMKGEKNLASLHMPENPLQNGDTSDQLGLRTLWRIFGRCIMPKNEHREIIRQNEKREKKAVYDELNRKPLCWNLGAIQRLHLPIPPNSELSRVSLENTWTEILGHPTFGDNYRLVDKAKLFELIEALHSPMLTKLRGSRIRRRYRFSESKKRVIGDYLEAVTLDVWGRMERGETNDVVAMLEQLNSSLKSSPSGQLGALMEIYRQHCIGQDPDGFICFVEEFIARKKEDMFIGMITLPGHPQDANWAMYWRKRLENDLGLVSEFENHPYIKRGPGRFGDSPVSVLKAFFEEFTPEKVTIDLAEKMNREGRADEASKFLSEKNLLPVDIWGEYFEHIGLVENAAESYCCTNIRKAEAEEILVAMDILIRNR